MKPFFISPFEPLPSCRSRQDDNMWSLYRLEVLKLLPVCHWSVWISRGVKTGDTFIHQPFCYNFVYSVYRTSSLVHQRCICFFSWAFPFIADFVYLYIIYFYIFIHLITGDTNTHMSRIWCIIATLYQYIFL